MKIDDETLEICKMLPEHEWEIGDWFYADDIPGFEGGELLLCGMVTYTNDCKTWPVTVIPQIDPTMEILDDWIKKPDTGFGIYATENPIWIPYVEHIMSLDVWPDDYWLGIEGSTWFIAHNTDVEVDGVMFTVEDLIVDAPTARLACLRAIRERLEGKGVTTCPDCYNPLTEFGIPLKLRCTKCTWTEEK
jgi:hypothetical protein